MNILGSFNKQISHYLKLKDYMKLSYKCTVILLALTTSHTILSAFDFAANQTGRLYENLPINIKNSGKKVTLKMPVCPKPSTVQIMYLYKISGTPESHGGLMQIIQFEPNARSQTIHILPPINQQNA